MAPKKSNKSKAESAAPPAASAANLGNELVEASREVPLRGPTMSPILEKPTLVVLPDGRQIYGALVAFDAQGSVILQNAIERRMVPSVAVSGESYVTQRVSPCMTIPYKHLVAFYQRDTIPPEVELLVKREEEAAAAEEAAAEKAAAAAAASSSS